MRTYPDLIKFRLIRTLHVLGMKRAFDAAMGIHDEVYSRLRNKP